MARNLAALSDVALFRLARSLPLPWSTRIGEYLGQKGGQKRPKLAGRADHNLRRLRPDLTDPKDIQAVLKQRWRNVGRNMLQLGCVDLIWYRGQVEVIGREHLEEAQAGGQRVAFTSVHLANWELTIAAAALLAPPLIISYEPRRSETRNQLVAATRARYGVEAHAGGFASARRLHQAFVEGEHNLLMFIDEVRDNQVAFPSFGRTAPPAGNVVALSKLAVAARCPIVPLYMTHRPDGEFTLTILPAVTPLTTAGGKADLPGNARMLEAIFAPLIKTHIDQWLMLHDLRLP
jgi:Kdo2-lipid IVA lauroyltransferase/acyltransferase